MKRLTPIEGLRAWLALWVLTGHVMGYSGYDDNGALSGLFKLLREGNLAVDVFIAISGFVIFLLLDKQSENYGQFVCRRFFRIYPLYLLLFLVAIPLSLLRVWTVNHGQNYLTTATMDFESALVHSAWQNWPINIPAHLTMLHGLVPDAWQGASLTRLTWLSPAWSISLEWQFYLVAPLLFALAASSKATLRLGVFALCAGLFYLGHRYPWGDGFLPFHLEFFFIGSASYFVFKRHNQAATTSEAPGYFLPATICAWMLFLLSGKLREVIPLGLWLVFFGLLLEQPASVFSRKLLPFFTHPVAQFLGKISYSIYLSHELVLIMAQAALLKWLPQLGQGAHFWALLILTMALTIAASTLLYRYIEAPGMKLGRLLAKRLGPTTSITPRGPMPVSA